MWAYSRSLSKLFFSLAFEGDLNETLYDFKKTEESINFTEFGYFQRDFGNCDLYDLGFIGIKTLARIV